jgi:hypothetical protein
MAPAPHQAGTDQLQSVAEDFGTGYHHSPPSGIEAALRDPDVIIGSERMRTAKSIVGAFAILVAGAASTAAQETAGGAAPYTDSGTFLVRRGADTIATEEFSRRGVELQGRLLFKAHKFLSERYRAVVAPDATVPLVEVTVRNGPDSGTVQAKFSQRTRIVFRDDSVAIDEIWAAAG